MKKIIIYALVLLSMDAIAESAAVQEVADKAAQSIWATNEILQSTNVDATQIKNIVDITFPCKIVFQTYDLTAHVLLPESSRSNDSCKRLVWIDKTDQNNIAFKNAFGFLINVIFSLSIIVNIFFIFELYKRNRSGFIPL